LQRVPLFRVQLVAERHELQRILLFRVQLVAARHELHLAFTGVGPSKVGASSDMANRAEGLGRACAKRVPT